MLSAPEEYLLKQGNYDDRAMYYIIKGDCVVLVQDHLTHKDIDKLQTLESDNTGNLPLLKKMSSERKKDRFSKRSASMRYK